MQTVAIQPCTEQSKQFVNPGMSRLGLQNQLLLACDFVHSPCWLIMNLSLTADHQQFWGQCFILLLKVGSVYDSCAGNTMSLTVCNHFWGHLDKFKVVVQDDTILFKPHRRYISLLQFLSCLFYTLGPLLQPIFSPFPLPTTYNAYDKSK